MVDKGLHAGSQCTTESIDQTVWFKHTLQYKQAKVSVSYCDCTCLCFLLHVAVVSVPVPNQPQRGWLTVSRAIRAGVGLGLHGAQTNVL